MLDIVRNFNVNFYHWVQQNIENEINTDLYLLKRIKGQLAIKSCHYIDSLRPEDRLNHLIALSNKSLQGKKGILISKFPTEADKKIWQEFNEAVFVKPLKPDYIEQFYKGDIFERIRALNVHQLRSEIQKACGSHLGRPVRQTSNVFSYETYIQNFVITTEIDLGGWFQLRYLHSVHYDDGSGDKPQRVVMADFLRWLGLGETAWEYMTDEDIPLAANILSQLCSNFLEGIRTVISESNN